MDFQAEDVRAGLYVHVPFCGRVCPYCDFAVRTGSEARRARYVDHLIAEVEMYRDWAIPFDTVYLGGGTPSCLSAAQLERLLEAAAVTLPVRDDAWLTLEANPEDVTAPSVAEWLALGARTISLGVQSFLDEELRFLGRAHDAAASRRAVRTALDSDLTIVSVDLIFGLPGQTPAALQRSIDAILELAPQHVSCYQLTFHRGTPFYRRLRRGEIEEMDESDQGSLYELVHGALADGGYRAYEVSSFARAEAFESRHNGKYWRHDPYLGLGPSAHSFNGGRARWWNQRALTDWEAALDRGRRPRAGSERLRRHDLALEAVMLGLRTRAGLDCDRLERWLGLDLWSANRDAFAELRREGLVRVDKRRVMPTSRGLAVADHLARRVRLPEA